METEVCALCGSEHLEQVLTASAFKILRCLTCGIAFTHPPPPPLDYHLRDFHSGENPEKADTLLRLQDLHPDWQKLIRLQVTLTREVLEATSSILEIGCGEGIFLEEMKKLHFDDLIGIEPSRSAVMRARSKGLQIENCNFNASQIDGQFKMIMMSHVLEHFENPVEVLDKLRNRLHCGGYLMLTQTNYLGLLPRVYGKDWYAWVPDQHYWHFTPASLGRLLRLAGYSVLRIKYCPLVHARTKLTRIANLFSFTRDQFVLLARYQGQGSSRLQSTH